jgi:hypothetical protein
MDPSVISYLLELLLAILHKYEFEEMMEIFTNLVESFGSLLENKAIELIFRTKDIIINYLQKDMTLCGGVPAIMYAESRCIPIVQEAVSTTITLTNILLKNP